MLASKGEIHKGSGWKRIREEYVFDCGQGFMEEGVLRSRRSRVLEDYGLLVAMILIGVNVQK